MPRSGIFIALEGPEGAGKTSQAKRLAEIIPGSIQVREPGGTRISEKIREILLDVENKGMHPLTEFFLFLAARVKFVDAIIRPALEEGKVVVADRFALSTMAYQIHARNLPVDGCLRAIDLAVQGYEPDMYILLMVDPEVGRARQMHQGKKADRLESESEEFHKKVYEGYKQYGLKQECWLIDTTYLSQDEVFFRIVQAVAKKFPTRLLGLLRSVDKAV